MKKMTRDLVATFGKSNGGTHDWTYKGLDPNLSAPEIKEACELLTTLDIFEQDGIKLFDSVVTAKVRIYEEELLFDPEHDPELEIEHANEPVSFSNAADKQEPAAFPTVVLTDKVSIEEQHENESMEHRSASVQSAEQSIPHTTETTKDLIEKKGLFQRIFRRRSRNKEDPNDN
ncbi:hypothetical protein ABQD97_14210 [Enterococcus avium]|jgi:hypothetical protein|uniref:DUF2922 family protein n=2 Tax=Enterococcus avium TaxID=33945 RepID=A0ABD5FAT1_ENTAV|nr:hypothetical protein [Enterococcus avium]MDT2388619.1 hypothetical protein [Enterococcus avium]MDT2399181.1 hypothetical protein [Enterococcus avium]MDT2421545.1 hypothetical protein [Enterococcus avium]MDT2449942.1 hypothetical protein [Enterococcus avium]MDT2484257.1 hypothetical protein [Enterococcus avium]